MQGLQVGFVSCPSVARRWQCWSFCGMLTGPDGNRKRLWQADRSERSSRCKTSLAGASCTAC